MTPPFQMRFRSCSFIWQLLSCACFSFTVCIDSSLSHHNIAVEGCLFHIWWRDCCVNYNIQLKERFEWGGSGVWVCPSTENAMFICCPLNIHEKAYSVRNSHIFSVSDFILVVFIWLQRRERGYILQHLVPVLVSSLTTYFSAIRFWEGSGNDKSITFYNRKHHLKYAGGQQNATTIYSFQLFFFPAKQSHFLNHSYNEEFTSWSTHFVLIHTRKVKILRFSFNKQFQIFHLYDQPFISCFRVNVGRCPQDEPSQI